MQMDTQRNLNIIRSQFAMIIENILAECRNGKDVEGEDLQQLVDEYVQKQLKQPEIFWPKKIKDINDKFETLYKKLLQSLFPLY